jgi:hypothetical protein
VRTALAIYFGSFALVLLWFIWLAAIIMGLIDTSDKVDPWPLVVAIVAMIGAKFALRSLAKKAETNG